jgi:uncharacterized protein YqgC (DUF456 family)
MDIVLFLVALLLSIIGIIGSIIPGLPGHPLNYLALWLVQWAVQPFSMSTLILFGVLTIVVFILDYYIPILTAKKYGATKQGIAGSIIGMFVGMFFTPIGMIIGTLAGAIIGDKIAGRTHQQAAKSGFATLSGTLLSIGFKLVIAGWMTVLVVYKLIEFIKKVM